VELYGRVCRAVLVDGQSQRAVAREFVMPYFRCAGKTRRSGDMIYGWYSTEFATRRGRMGSGGICRMSTVRAGRYNSRCGAGLRPASLKLW